MNTLLQELDPSITYALGWTIIHSFWQASLIALFMSLIHKFSNNKSAFFKYRVSVISMVVVLLISTITFTIYYSTTSANTEMLATIDFGTLAISEGNEPTILGEIKLFFANNITHINLIWGVGVILFLIRFVFSYLYTKYLRNTAQYENSKELVRILSRLKSRLLIDRVIGIAESSKIDVPLVLGHFKPLILFPIGMINVLTTEEVEAIITHEIAHIKRFDYLTNILMTLVEILFYFHPAVWWISANVKVERENCCDDYALSNNIDKVVYAKALVKLEEIKSHGTPLLAMPFSSKKHQLINRIKRIMNMPQTQNDIKEKSIATILLLSIILLFNTQANSETAIPDYNLDVTTVIDTVRLRGNDEMILTVKEGRFESLEVDKVIQEGEIVEQIASTVNRNSTDKSSYTLTMKDKPVLLLANDKVSICGQGGAIYESEDYDLSPQSKKDTIPNRWEENATTIFQKDGKTIEIEKNNGEITKLKIDGKEIPKNEYGSYQEEIESINDIYEFDFDENIFKGFDEDNFSKSFGLLFDGENWREFGGNFEQLMDKDLFKKLEDMEHMRFDFKGLEGLKELEKLGDLRGLEQLRELEGLGNLKDMEKLEDLFKEMGITIDTTFNGMNFKFRDFDGFNGFDFFNDEDIIILDDKDSNRRSGTVVDKIGEMLNKDGLLKEYKSNKIEITGKHLKINGEKMPNALFEKYKSIYQESTGAPLTKKSKMVFDVEGKPSKRRVKTF